MAEIQIFSPEDPEVEFFRRRVLENDLSVEPQACDSILLREELYRAYGNHPEKEEIYKFSKSKWSRSRFDKIIALVEDGKIVSISGSRVYGSFVRVGMFYYTLKAYRKTHRSLLWRKGGFLDATINEFPQAEGYFVSIYPHNRRLKAWAERLIAGQQFAQMGHQEPGVLSNLQRFRTLPKFIHFHGVLQLIMYTSPKSSEIPENFLTEITSR